MPVANPRHPACLKGSWVANSKLHGDLFHLYMITPRDRWRMQERVKFGEEPLNVIWHEPHEHLGGLNVRGYKCYKNPVKNFLASFPHISQHAAADRSALK